MEESFGSINVDAVTSDLISRHLAALNLAERTKKNHRDSVGFFNRWLVLRGYLAKGMDWLRDEIDPCFAIKVANGSVEAFTFEPELLRLRRFY